MNKAQMMNKLYSLMVKNLHLAKNESALLQDRIDALNWIRARLRMNQIKPNDFASALEETLREV